LIIDTDAKLTLAVAVERFQSIAAECCKIVQIACSLKAIKPGFRLPCKTRELFDVINEHYSSSNGCLAPCRTLKIRTSFFSTV